MGQRLIVSLATGLGGDVEEARRFRRDPSISINRTMTITLSSDEAIILRAYLADVLPQLQRETAATDARDLRLHLLKRQEVVERLLRQLDQVTA